jgi:hypothetical protein
MSERTSGRRIAEAAGTTRRGPSPVLVVGLVAVLVSALALAGMKGSDESEATEVREARYRPLTSQSLSCPAAQNTSSGLVVGSLTESTDAGEIIARTSGAGSARPIEVAAGEVTPVRVGDRPAVLSGTGGSAPGLVGARFATSGVPSFAECVVPDAETWFNGAGAGGLHESKLLLVNPDRGPAVADVTMWTTTGEVAAPTVRGVTVPGGESVEIDLAEVAPTREEITLRVSVTRGRIASTMSDSYTPRGGARRTDSLPASQAPAQTQWIPGMARKSTEAVLVVANPGADAARVALSVVGEETEFEPEGFDEIRVPAGQVVVQELPKAVTQLLSTEDATLKLSSTKPVTGGVRAVVANDFAQLPAATNVEGDAAAVVPTSGERTLTLTGVDGSGSAKVSFVGASGKDASTTVRLRPSVSTAIELPRGTTAVIVRSDTASAGAVRTISAEGISISPLRPLVTEKVIADVRPQW